MAEYKATPELWAHVERASNNPRDIATLFIELRARVEALEAKSETQCLAVLDWAKDVEAMKCWNEQQARRIEALEAAQRPASKVYEISEPLQLTPEQEQQVRDLLAPGGRRNYPAKPDSSLVDRVSTAIALVDEEHYWPEERDAVETDMARAAIREVALWLNEASLDLYPGDCDIVVNTLYDQANQ